MTDDFFAQPPTAEPNRGAVTMHGKVAPLASRMRPRTLEEYLAAEHVTVRETDEEDGHEGFRDPGASRPVIKGEEGRVDDRREDWPSSPEHGHNGGLPGGLRGSR